MENETHRNRHSLTSAERKQMPIHRGALKYFPDALMVVGMLSKRADLKHSPDADPDDLSRPQWVKGASADHGDCLVRHQLDLDDMDAEVGLRYVAHVAWRGLAQLQTYIETHGINAVVDWDWEPPRVGKFIDATGEADTEQRLISEPAKYELIPGFECAHADGDLREGQRCAVIDPSAGQPTTDPGACLSCDCYAQLREVADDA